MATLQTGDFRLRALPQVARLNPADYDAGIGNILGLVERGMQLPARLEGVRATQRQGRLERATEPQRLELAQQQAASGLELLPYEAAAAKEKAVRAFDQPGGEDLYYDAQGNLVRSEVILETDPITGQQANVTVPRIIKTAEQVNAEKEITASLAQSRILNAEAARERAGASSANAATLGKLREAQAAALAKGGKGRTATAPVPGPRGRQAGIIEIQYDGVGNTIRRTFTPAVTIDPVTRRPNTPEPIDLPLDDMVNGAQPTGESADPDNIPFSLGAPAPADVPLDVGGELTDQSAVVVPRTPTAPVAPAAPVAVSQPNDAQVQLLRRNPALAADFDAMFGAGAAARILGGQ